MFDCPSRKWYSLNIFYSVYLSENDPALLKKTELFYMKKKILISAVILIVVIFVIIVAVTSSQKTSKDQNGAEKQTNQQDTNIPSAEVTADITAEEEIIEQEEIILPVAEVQEINNDAIPKGAIQLTVSDQGFSPKEFSVATGRKVSLAITSTDGLHSFFFLQDPTLALVNATIAPEITQLVEFTAPKAGEYIFQDQQLPNNHGKMIVK